MNAFVIFIPRQFRIRHYYCQVCEEEGGAVVAVMNLRMEGPTAPCRNHRKKYWNSPLQILSKPGRKERICLRSVVKLQRIEDVLKMEAASNQLRERTITGFICGEEMNNFHYKFSKRLVAEKSTVNVLGR